MFERISLLFSLFFIGCVAVKKEYSYTDENIKFQLEGKNGNGTFKFSSKSDNYELIFKRSNDSIFIVKDGINYLFFVDQTGYIDNDSILALKRKNANIYMPFANIVKEYDFQSKQIWLEREGDAVISEDRFITGIKFDGKTIGLVYYNGVDEITYELK